MKHLFIPFLTNLIYQGSCFADILSGEASTEMTLKGSPILTIGYIFQVFISLLIVIGIIYLCAKYVLPRLQITSSSRLIEVVDRMGLEPQVTAFIIKVRNKSWLIVSSKGSVAVVDKIDTEEKEERS